MKIKEILHQRNNDFKAKHECPLCGHSFIARGYWDNNFFDNVMPNAICKECGKNEHGETKDQSIK